MKGMNHDHLEVFVASLRMPAAWNEVDIFHYVWYKRCLQKMWYHMLCPASLLYKHQYNIVTQFASFRRAMTLSQTMWLNGSNTTGELGMEHHKWCFVGRPCTSYMICFSYSRCWHSSAVRGQHICARLEMVFAVDELWCNQCFSTWTRKEWYPSSEIIPKKYSGNKAACFPLITISAHPECQVLQLEALFVASAKT